MSIEMMWMGGWQMAWRTEWEARLDRLAAYLKQVRAGAERKEDDQ